MLPKDAVPSGLDDGAVHLWLMPGAHVVHYPVRGGAETAVVIIVEEGEAARGWSTPVEAGAVRELAERFSPPLRALVAQGEGWKKWSLHLLPRLPGLARGRVALLGDAAHPVLPFLAQGAVLALEDAVVVADCLATESDVAAALRTYQRRRLRRVAKVAAASRRNGDIFHLSGLLATARNATLATVPGRLMMGRYDWLYGWGGVSASWRGARRLRVEGKCAIEMPGTAAVEAANGNGGLMPWHSKAVTRQTKHIGNACSVLVASLFAVAGPAHAGSVTLKCARADVINPAWNAPLTFVYDGGASGTLKVSGVFGDFSIPAKRSAMEIAGEKGEAIDGVANAKVKLPSLPELEACIEKGGGSAGGDSDAYANARDACLRKLPAASSGVDAVAQVRLGITGPDGSGEDAFVTFKLRYEGSSKAPGGAMVVEAFPAQCTLKK
ncbi:MAG: FAD-dependent monooxygenase [Hyphomicrobium sp.]